MLECHCRGGNVAVPTWLAPSAMHVVVTHASAKVYAAQANKRAGWTAAMAEENKWTRFRKNIVFYSGHAGLWFVPFAPEACGCMTKEVAVALVSCELHLGRRCGEGAQVQGL